MPRRLFVPILPMTSASPSDQLSLRVDPRLPSSANQRFLLRLAELLHAQGTPADRLEDTLTSCALKLREPGQFLSTPTSLMAAFGDGDEQHVHMLRVSPGDVNLVRMLDFDEVLGKVEEGKMSAEAGLAELNRIAASPPRFGPGATVLAFAMASAGAARFFEGGLREILLSFLLGLLTGMLALSMGRRSAATRVFEPCAAFLAAFLSILVAHYLVPLNASVVILSSLIVLVPGLSLTLAMNELATRHLVSGTARLMGALMIFLTIILGVAMGRELGNALAGGGFVDVETVKLAGWTLWPAFIVSCFAFIVLFQGPLRQTPWIMAVALSGFVGARVGATLMGPELGTFLGALMAGLPSNVYARITGHPAQLTLLPGILMLVPGSIGFRSLSFFLAQDAVSGMEAAFQTMLVAVALVGGLLTANVVFVPRESL